jgi:DNA/RNA-binding protein KIN17
MGKGKAEVGTPKYLANKMKAKGLQKLRWYCQMCAKQCRDENGFKCHINTEAHQRQMLLFGQNPGSYTYEFSKDYHNSFMDILRRQFGTKRVKANKVYQEVIADRNHVHMNSTRWHTLTGYVQWLGKNSIATVDLIEDEWYVTYIERDPETLERQRKEARKKKQDKDDEERLQEFIEKQVEKNKKEDTEEPSEKFSEFVRESEEEKIKLDLKLFKKPEIPALAKPIDLKATVKVENEEKYSKTLIKKEKTNGTKRSALDEIMESEEKSKEKKNRKDYWLSEGIVVKIVTKSLGEKYYKEKAVVKEVIDKYRAKVRLVESGEKFKLDQAHLETVIPKVDGRVKVLNGGYRDCTAVLKSIETDDFSVTIEIDKGPLKGRIVKGIPYEDISKIYQE